MPSCFSTFFYENGTLQLLFYFEDQFIVFIKSIFIKPFQNLTLMIILRDLFNVTNSFIGLHSYGHFWQFSFYWFHFKMPKIIFLAHETPYKMPRKYCKGYREEHSITDLLPFSINFTMINEYAPSFISARYCNFFIRYQWSILK